MWNTVKKTRGESEIFLRNQYAASQRNFELGCAHRSMLFA